MKDTKKRKGTKVKLTKGKRVSLRCPLTVDSTQLEFNYDTDCVQVCMTVENIGGGGVTEDSVESAIIVIRLFDAAGQLIPCTKNEYFAKLLRFGDEGLQSGANITFRLTPDCENSHSVENIEIYISRVRYTDGSVTDYLRGDFFDLPGDPIPLHKKHKKHIEAITAKFGDTARYVPENLTDIIWRCTCGEFCESEQCSACSTNKNELFDFFATITPQKAAVAAPIPVQSQPTDSYGSDNAPATDATTEYDPEALAAGVAAAADSGASEPSDQQPDTTQAPIPTPPPPKKTDSLKIGLIIAIIASSIVLAVIIGLLIFAFILQSKQAQRNADSTNDAATTTVSSPEDQYPANELRARGYLTHNLYQQAYDSAVADGCSQTFINEILTAAVQYYTEVEPDEAQVMKFAALLGDTDSIEAINKQHYDEAIEKGDYQAAIEYAQLLTNEKDAMLSAAAEGLVQSQLAENKYDAAMTTVKTYSTVTTAEDVNRAALTYYTSIREYDKALSLAEELDDQVQIKSIAQAAIDYCIEQYEYEKAITYIERADNSENIEKLLPFFTKADIKKHLPLFFPYLTFEDQQAVHASVISASANVGFIDPYGNCFLSAEPTVIPLEPRRKAVSVECSSQTIGVLFSDGSVEVYGDNRNGQCNVWGWTDIVAISVSDNHTIGLRADGTVVATGLNNHGQCNVSQYTDVVAIAAGGWHTLLLFADGTVTAIGINGNQCNTSEWKDIVMISAGLLHSVGLKSDGTVVAAGSTGAGRCKVSDWTDVIQISAGETCTVGLKSDGTVLLTDDNYTNGDVSGMTNIIYVYAGKDSVTALRSNGTLLTTGNTPPDLTFTSGYEISTKIYGIE